MKIHLIGHSIGGYISLELLKIDDISKRIHHCYLLFPTFEYMADSMNGKLYINILQKYFKLMYYGAKFIDLLPEFLRIVGIRIVYWFRSIPFEYTDVTLTLIRPDVLSKIMFMADDEMKYVLEADYNTIEENKNRLTFFYSFTDGWTPVTYYERLISRIPNVNAQITDKFDHAFTLKTSHNMAALLSQWIQQNKIQVN